MENRIALALSKLFERHRIVFWYDIKKELRIDFDSLQLDSIEKIELTNNEYGVKYRILREHPDQKFLLYKEGAQPDDLANWLLDIQLAHGEFRTDQVGIWLSDLELGLEFSDVIEPHTEFFKATKRLEKLKTLIKPDDTRGMIRLKMLAVCTGAEHRIDTILEALLAELSENRDERFQLIAKCGLEEFLWEQLKRFYGYSSETASIKDFVIELFKSCYAMGTEGPVKLTADALVFLKRWKDSRQHEAAFETLSSQCAEPLNIEQDLSQRDFRTLIELDYFLLIDQKIISELVKSIAAKTVSSGNVALWVRQRRQSHWYRELHHLYEAADYAAQFLPLLNEANLTMESLADGIQRYSRSWFKIDQLYRKFIYHVRSSGQASLMGPLNEQIENLYSNNYLLKINDNWQVQVDAASKWDATPIPLQRKFFDRWVYPFLQKDNKISVIISDGLRYEIGDEFLSLMRQEDRYDASLEPIMTMLPSYTQLGMAALLPNKELAFVGNDTGAVSVDGQSSQGTANRIKILGQATKKRVTAVKADELMAMKGENCRALIRDHDVLYVYHNHIDFTGDKRESEERVFEAVEETLQELIKLVKKLTAANANNILLTSDHGFIYQNRIIEESDFSGAEVEGDVILFKDRRFVYGKGLKENIALKKFKASEIGLTGDLEIQIPKSINRLRLKGSGSRYVHGGASLQEVVIPVIKINKKRQSDLSVVEVEILRGSTSVISTGQLAVSLYQLQPASDKVQKRILRCGIYTDAGALISDCHELTFDLVSKNARERELQVRFVLTREADKANGQEVILRLEEKVSGTSHYTEYKAIRYVVRRSFKTDFDL